MSLTLPPVGTSQLLELVSPYAPDDFIAEVCPRHFTGGRGGALCGAPPVRAHFFGAAARLECRATVAHAFVGGADVHAFAQSARGATARASRVAAFRPVAARTAHGPDAP